MSLLYDPQGRRKYLTAAERQAFLLAAKRRQPNVYTFCATLAYTGARLSEVLSLAPAHFDLDNRVVLIECLKKRRRGIYRAVPIPENFVSELDDIHMIDASSFKNANFNNSFRKDTRLWPWGRTTGWKYVKSLMATIGISGPHASPKGLRHSFGVCAIQKQVPLNMVRKWLGHSSISTTAIYADAIGDEEREIANRMWRAFL